jgi:hypothetical protein
MPSGVTRGTVAWHPTYGYLSDDGHRRGFPDAMVLPFDPDSWKSGSQVTDAIAVEYERTEKLLDDYKEIIAAYRDTAWRTAPEEAIAEVTEALRDVNHLQMNVLPVLPLPRGGRYRHVLYVCENPRIKGLVEKAGRELRVGDFVLTMMAPAARFNRSPERTTQPWVAGKRRGSAAAVDVQLMRLPKAQIVEYLVRMGLAEAAAEAMAPPGYGGDTAC